MFLKSALSFPCSVHCLSEGLCFDVLLCDEDFSRFSSQGFFALLLKHGKFRFPR